MSTTKVNKPTRERWVECGMDNPFIYKPKYIKFVPPRIKPIEEDDYQLLDYLMACMAYDMKEFSASAFTAGSLSYLLGKYGESFTIVGHKLYKHYLREKQTYAY